MKIDGLAGRGQRLLATLIDALLVPSLSLLLIMITDVVEDAQDFTDNWWILHVLMLSIAAYLLLNGWLLWQYGQTIGKRVMRIAVIDANAGHEKKAQPAAFWKLIFVRAWFFPLLFVGLVPPITLAPVIDLLFIFSPQRRCLHDRLCGTQVVKLAKANPT